MAGAEILTYQLPDANEAKLFVIKLDVSTTDYAACESLLNAEELSRANRFVHADVRRRFVVCRGHLRRVLGEMSNVEPAQVGFHYERWGKPQLSTRQATVPLGRNLHFNVSHSGEWALIAVAHTPVGVDVEVFNERISYRAIASQILSQREQIEWERLSGADRESATLQLWVCKEALLKAMGLGIAEGLKQVTFPLPIPEPHPFAPAAIDGQLQMHLEDDGSCRSNHWIDASEWRLRMLNIIPDSQAALCTAWSIEKITIE